MKKLNISLILFLSLANISAPAQNADYVVNTGDTLSGIVRKKFPKDSIYGNRGKLSEVLKKNSSIKNPNVIYPQQVILFSSDENKVIEANSEAQKTEPIFESYSSESESNTRHAIFALLGLKFTSLDQDGLPGEAKIGELSLPVLRLGYDFQRANFLFFANTEVVQFSVLGQSQTNTSVELGAGWKNIIASLSVSELPIYEVSATNNPQLHKQKLTSALVGYDHYLNTEYYPLKVNLRAGLQLPLKQSIEVPSLNSASPKGIGAKLLASIDYTLSNQWILRWQNDIAIWQIKNATSNSSASVETKFQSIEFTSAVGLKREF